MILLVATCFQCEFAVGRSLRHVVTPGKETGRPAMSDRPRRGEGVGWDDRTVAQISSGMRGKLTTRRLSSAVTANIGDAATCGISHPANVPR